MGFDEFYTRYPRKVGKGAARKAFARALKIASLEEIIEGLENSVHYWESEGTEKQFIPHPATWLNGERWCDELEIDISYLSKKPFPNYTDDEWALYFSQNEPTDYVRKYMPEHIRLKYDNKLRVV